MKFTKLDLLTLLISLFILTGCKKSLTIGLEIDPESAIEGSFVDTLTIHSRTVLEEVGQTNGLNRHPLGYLIDPIFGTTESNIAFAVGLPANPFSFGTEPTLDSAVLILPYSSEFYGDTTNTFSFDVHQLKENIALGDRFPSNATYAYETPVLGSKTTKIFPTTRVKVIDPLNGIPDTVANLAPQLRIRLNNQFVSNNILNASTSTLKNDFNFSEVFKGLYVKVDKSKTTRQGGISYINLNEAGAYITIYYKTKNPNNTPVTIDTLKALFPIGTANRVSVASIKHDYTGTPVAEQLSKPNQQFERTYLQGTGGLRNKITFPYFTKFRAEAGKIVINKAELVVDLEPGTNLFPFEASARLALYRNDIANQRKNIPDNEAFGDSRGLDQSVFGGYFNAAKNQYVFVVTSYIQDLMTGKVQDYGTFLGPTPLDQHMLNPAFNTSTRSIIRSQNKATGNQNGTLKLNIYYTKVD
ncbi:MAG: DUF4270 domain-containing protein [Pedobacter sp.]|nr:MAG: DUF4270 domain-containing protein [Pedobacter sp.]